MAGAFHRIARAFHLGDGAHEAFADGFTTDANFRRLGGEPGMMAVYRIGNCVRTYQILRNRTGGALAIGNPVIPYMATSPAGRTGVTAAATNAVVTTADTFAANELDGGLIHITAGVGAGQTRHILEHSTAAGASTVTIAKYDRSLNTAAVSTADAYGTTPAVGGTYEISTPWEVVQSTAAAGGKVIAVALSAVPDGQWGIFQVTGPGEVLCVGDVNPVVQGNILVTSAAAAGYAMGFTGAGMTAVEAASAFGIACEAYAGGAPGQLIPAYLNCLRFNPYTPVGLS